MHLDLKPENLLVVPSPEPAGAPPAQRRGPRGGVVLKVSDFGLSDTTGLVDGTLMGPAGGTITHMVGGWMDWDGSLGGLAAGG